MVKSRSAQPMRPRPIRRFDFTVASISGSGYGFISITSSRKRTASRTTRSISSQSIDQSPSSPRRANFETLSEPRLHASFGSNGCSPQGLVASTMPISGVGFAGLALIRSMKIIPGSPVRQAARTIRSKTSFADSRPVTAPVCGFTRSYSVPAASASMNLSVAATEMLKLVIPPSSLHSMNSRMSGWSTRRMPMFAPRRVPPCLTASVALLKTRRNEMGPEARPPVDATMSSFGRRREKAKPVPPPDLWMIAAAFTESKISSIESPTGRT